MLLLLLLRLSLGAQEAMSPGLVAVELANIVLTPF